MATGAMFRWTGAEGAPAVVCVDGGQGNEVPGTWSSSLEWLVRRLGPRFPRLGFGEVRYRIKSWRQLDLCIEDARAAVHEAGAARTLLLGFSMGGAVAVRAADEPTVETVIGLAPWIPDRVGLENLRARRLVVLHGSLDRPLPGIPGVSPSSSHRAYERARDAGVDATYATVAGGVHGLAVRARGGRLVPLPRARRWASLVAAELARFEAAG